MRTRCYNENAANFKRYGGAGVRVCKRWRTSFENFLVDMGERPQGTSLDRVDNGKGYSKRNCRWSTIQQQNQNRRTTKLNAVKVQAIRKDDAPFFTYKEIAVQHGVSTSLISNVVAGKSWASI